jgi:3-hydroxyisobutyrate dehydrogenase
MTIGFCGTGRMGAAMVDRLLDVGRRVTVWNRTPDKARPLIERGAIAAGSPAEVAVASEIVLTILTDATAVSDVYAGPRGLLSGGAAAGKLFIEMSTIEPEAVQGLAGRVREAGGALVECPVGGTVGPAREGKLLGFAGGAAADVARARPVLEQLCRRVDHLGANGAGAAMKLAVNLPLVVYWEALGEAMSLCRDAGIEPELMLEIMKESSGGTNALRNRAGKIVEAIRGGAKPEIGFDIDGMRKDLRTMLGVARAMGVALPVLDRTLECYDEAARDGWGNRDASTMAAFRLGQNRKARR